MQPNDPFAIMLPMALGAITVTNYLLARCKPFLDVIPGPLFDPSIPGIRDASFNVIGLLLNVGLDFAFIQVYGLEVPWLTVVIFAALQQAGAVQVYKANSNGEESPGKTLATKRREAKAAAKAKSKPPAKRPSGTNPPTG